MQGVTFGADLAAQRGCQCILCSVLGSVHEASPRQAPGGGIKQAKHFVALSVG